MFLCFWDPSWRENDRVLLYNATAQFIGWLGSIFANWPISYILSIVLPSNGFIELKFYSRSMYHVTDVLYVLDLSHFSDIYIADIILGR